MADEQGTGVSDEARPFAFLGERLRTARRAAGLTQADAAAALGMERSNVANYESGRIDVPYSRLAQLATAYGVSAGWFFGDEPIVGPTWQGAARLAWLSLDALTDEADRLRRILLHMREPEAPRAGPSQAQDPPPE